MRRAALACLVALAPLQALACSTNPPIETPPIEALARDAGLVAIVHVDRIRPLTDEQIAYVDRVFTNPPTDVPIRLPTATTEFTVVRELKGRVPTGSVVRNGVTSCDVILVAGYDYVLFAAPSDAGDGLVPLRGTFAVDEGERSRTAIAEIESLLSNSPQTSP